MPMNRCQVRPTTSRPKAVLSQRFRLNILCCSFNLRPDGPEPGHAKHGPSPMSSSTSMASCMHVSQRPLMASQQYPFNRRLGGHGTARLILRPGGYRTPISSSSCMASCMNESRRPLIGILFSRKALVSVTQQNYTNSIAEYSHRESLLNHYFVVFTYFKILLPCTLPKMLVLTEVREGLFGCMSLEVWLLKPSQHNNMLGYEENLIIPQASILCFPLQLYYRHLQQPCNLLQIIQHFK